MTGRNPIYRNVEKLNRAAPIFSTDSEVMELAESPEGENYCLTGRSSSLELAPISALAINVTILPPIRALILEEVAGESPKLISKDQLLRRIFILKQIILLFNSNFKRIE